MLKSSSWPKIHCLMDLDEALEALIPLSRTMKEDVPALKEWAKTRARIANTRDDEPEDQRKLRYLNP